MASYGKVLDLLDDRYLNLQDVMGNVEPFPALVPYEQYTQNVLVYKMDTTHEIFMGLIQDFTDRTARQWGKELWTWAVQWEVEQAPSSQKDGFGPASKKPRMDLSGSVALTPTQLPPRRPAYTVVERRFLDAELMKEEDMLRILIDIVQIESRLVPNFIEFLYRWIDFYEGDGYALQAAVRQEIPSLWDFEYHPVVLRDQEVKNRNKAEETEKTEENNNSENVEGSLETKKEARKKPDLAAMEQKAERSERMQYKEVRFGLQPPKPEDEPMPPLINVPKDYLKRQRYYAACFKTRQRALFLLNEAGITMRQISNYEKMQKAHPKETSEERDGKGLANYLKDKPFAQHEFALKEKRAADREKNKETIISNRLAVEAQQAMQNAATEAMDTSTNSGS